jgi:hypothetical protein
LRTPARNLDEKTIAHLRLRRPDDGRRSKDLFTSQTLGHFSVAAPERAPEASFLRIQGLDHAPDAHGHVRAFGSVSLDRAVRLIGHLVE